MTPSPQDDPKTLVSTDWLAKHLRDPDMVHRYKELRDQRDDKGARDFLRQYGAAVRYGFNRRGDQLGLFKLDGDNSFGLWAN